MSHTHIPTKGGQQQGLPIAPPRINNKQTRCFTCFFSMEFCLKHHKQFQQQNAFEGEQALDYPAGALPALLRACSQTIAAVSQAKRFEESSLLMPLIRSSLDE